MSSAPWLREGRAKVRVALLATLLSGAAIATFESSAASTARVPEAQPAAPAFAKALRARLENELSARGPEYQPRTIHRRPDGGPRFTNRLLLEKSPYLQQHAHNPVNWHPWGPEAFAEAKRLGRPVLVSIGYSTCHWCHVMEEESFDRVEVAEVLNASFVAIKVDREARPDVDAIYMSAIHAMGQRGGWPLNIFVTADAKPFFGGTYFPREDRAGRPGFIRVLNQVARVYRDDRESIESNADGIVAHLKKQLEGHGGTRSAQPGPAQLAGLVAHFARIADREWGGVGRGTKFPSSLPIGFLLREWRRTGNEDALALVTLTLDKMAAGGIHDHLAGGFHRYSTEPRWLVPHFEKMLYDNALIGVSYLEAFQATGDAAYEVVLRGLLDYVLREMTDDRGGFYSATDADSLTPGGESEEGYFFTWTPGEVQALLGPEDARVAIAWYGIVEEGPLEGRSVLHTWRDEAKVAASLGLTREAFEQKLEMARAKMLAARAERTAPLRDEKILVAWNGLMISAFARAGFALSDPRYVDAAARAADFILTTMGREGRGGGRLHRVSLAGEAAGPAFLEDYACLIGGLIDLYEATADVRWIEAALRFQEVQEKHYADATGGGYYRTADDGEMLLARGKPIEDGALPSGNSLAAANLSRLHALTGDDRFRERLALLYSAFASVLEGVPAGADVLMKTVSDREAGLREIVLVEAGDAQERAAMLEPVRRLFVPTRILIRATAGKAIEELALRLPIVGGKTAIGGKTTAYVCENRVCQFPTNDPAVLRRQLMKRSAAAPATGAALGRVGARGEGR